METPVLLLGYNRPQLVAQQLTFLVKKIGAKHIYVAVDGPKKNRLDEKKAQGVRKVVHDVQEHLPKGTHLQVHFSSSNLGCQKGVEAGLHWFFEHVPAGIILEDDCVPHPDFFRYCTELLIRFGDDKRIGMICGTNPVLDTSAQSSYFFSHQSLVWGWATWKRAWHDYAHTKKIGLKAIQKASTRESLRHFTTEKHLQVIERVLQGEIDTWDYIWYLTNLLEGRLCIVPRQNLISNVGFTADATHTKVKTTQSQLPVSALHFPLTHPEVFTDQPSFEQRYLKQIQKWRVLLSVFLAYSGLADRFPVAAAKMNFDLRGK